MLDIQDLQTVINLFHYQSFSLTATKMFTTQSNISKRLRKIESMLGLKICEKSGRKLYPTADGKNIQEYGTKIINLSNQLLEVLGKSELYKDNFRIGASESIVFLLLPQILVCYQERYPNISFDLQVDTSGNLRQRILNKQIDIAYLLNGTNDPTYVNIPMINYELGWFIARKLVKSESPTFKKLIQRLPIITFSQDTPPYVDLTRILKQKNLTEYRIHNCASLSTIVSLTIGGMGIGLFPTKIGLQKANHNKLLRIKGYPIPDLRYFISYKKETAPAIQDKLADMALAVVNK